MIEQVFADLTTDEVERRLDAAGIPHGRIRDVYEVATAHPQLEARGRWYDVPSEVGPVRALQHPMNIVGLRRGLDAVPAVGEHTQEILAELETEATL